MFEENKEPVTDVTENVEQPTEEVVSGDSANTTEEVTEEKKGKFYTDEEFDKIIQTRLGRQERSLKRDFKKELAAYKEAETVLNAGLGTSNITEATNNLRDFYTKKGINIPQYTPSYSESDMKVLANAEAQSIIEAGFEDVVEEVDRLADIGLDNMSPRERLVFNQLATYRKREQDKQELAKIGVNETALQEQEFVEFAEKLNPNMSIKDKYEMYTKYRPKPKVEPIGSMKNATSKDSGVKDFYTREEALKFTKKDFDKNPALFKAVEKSMLRW